MYFWTYIYSFNNTLRQIQWSISQIPDLGH